MTEHDQKELGHTLWKIADDLRGAILAFLRLHGCDEVQGYYFRKPLAA